LSIRRGEEEVVSSILIGGSCLRFSDWKTFFYYCLLIF
jgi:hypothetical protein